MTITNGYCTQPEFKERLWPIGVVDAQYDTLLDQVATAVSRLIDGYCGRRFYAVTETNYFTRTTPYVVLVEDLLTVTTLKTDADGDRTYESTWAATDYDLEPYNAARLSPARPYTRIVTAPNGVYTFPNVRKGIEIAGSWGFSATTPPAVKEACLLQCARLYLRKDTPFGVTGSAEMGHLSAIPKLDPDVKLLLDPFKKIGL